MTSIENSKADSYPRGHFLGMVAGTLAVSQLATIGSAAAQAVAAHTSFGTLKQINAGLLSVGYAEAGPPDGPAVVLLHGWPYDIHSFVDVTPILAEAGYHVIIPYTRGFGPT